MSETPPPRTPTLEELSVLPTRARLPVVIEGVTFADGAPVRLVLEAVSFEQEMAANRAALREGQRAGIGFCEDTWALEMAMALIAEPKLDRDHKRILLRANASIIHQIVEAGEALRTIPARLVEAELERLAGVAAPPLPSEDAADPGEPG